MGLVQDIEGKIEGLGVGIGVIGDGIDALNVKVADLQAQVAAGSPASVDDLARISTELDALKAQADLVHAKEPA